MNVKPQDKIRFQYVDRNNTPGTFPTQVVYKTDLYEGVVVAVRDIEQDGLQFRTVRNHPEVERSRYLLTVQLPDNRIKSFYSGRVINLQHLKRKNFIRRLLGV